MEHFRSLVSDGRDFVLKIFRSVRRREVWIVRNGFVVRRFGR